MPRRTRTKSRTLMGRARNNQINQWVMSEPEEHGEIAIPQGHAAPKVRTTIMVAQKPVNYVCATKCLCKKAEK